MRLKLKPLISAKQEAKPFGVFDIEARGWINHVITGFYCKDSKGNDILEYFHSGKNDIEKFFEFIMSADNPVDEIYAHYGGIFDFLYVFKEAFQNDNYLIESIIPRGSGILCFDFSKVERTTDSEFISTISPKMYIEKKGRVHSYRARTIKFRDTSAMLPFSLESLSKNFGVEHKKLKTDYENLVLSKELIKYLEHDLKGLYQVIQTYREWPIIKKAGPAHTMASQAMRVFRTTMTKEIESLPRSVDTFVRASYFGGRTEIYKPLFYPDKNSKELINCFDVNSLYPTIMRTISRFPGNFKEFTTKYDPEALGFYDAEVYVPEDMYIPPLGLVHDVKGSNKFIFPAGKFKGRWSTLELEYARSVGVKILKTGQGALFHDAGALFRRYIDILYDIRLRATKNSVDDILAKLLMNSCYGRFGLNLLREQIAFTDNPMDPDMIGEIPLGNGRVFHLTKKEVLLRTSFTNVAIPAWVTSGARIFMHKKKLPIQDSVYYEDTDSLFTTLDLGNSSDLGEFKWEYSGDAACFLLPKTYAIRSPNSVFKYTDKDGVTTLTDKKVVMKGFDRHDVRGFTIEDFKLGLEGELRHLQVKTSSRMARFKTAIRKGDMLSMVEASTKGINSLYDKRRIVKTFKGYDTEPLVIKNGEIINVGEDKIYEQTIAEKNERLRSRSKVLQQSV